MNVNNEHKHKIEEIQKLLSRQKVQAASKLLQELVALRPHDPKVLVLLGIAALKQNDLSKAEQYLLLAIEKNDAESQAHFQLATLYLHQGQFDKAIEQYQKVSAFDAEHLQAEINLGEAFESNWRYLEAEFVYKRVLQEDPYHSIVLDRLGGVLKKLGKTQESEEIYKKALEASPKSFATLNHLGALYQDESDFNNAILSFEKTLVLKPENVTALFGLTHSRNQKQEFPEAKKLENLSQKGNLTADEMMLLHFGLGKIYDDRENSEKAFFHFHAANQICAKRDPFDIRSFANTVKGIMQLFNAKFIHDKKIVPSFEKIPLFIVGMPLSGKHLLQKTLALHQDISFVGEQRLLINLLKESWHVPALMEELTNDDLRKIANDYIAGMSKLALKEAPFFCDIMPNNHLFLGVIAILFPQAKIIHCTRHPLDLCLASYTLHHAIPRGYAHDLAMLGRYYQHYANLMGYWQSIGIDNRIEVKYEELVQTPKKTLTEVFEFLELPFETDTFPIPSFHTHEVGRWQKYQPYLHPLIEVLYQQ